MTSGGAHDCSIAAQIKAITGDAVVEVGADAIESTFVRGFVGATICSGGVCREVPAFEGLLLQFVGRL
jgi:hypothetical protein